MKNIEIHLCKNAIEVNKENGTHVYYHIFPEYEIHINEIAPHTIQEWHYHSCIEEVILVNEGILTCYERMDKEVQKYIVHEGDIVCVKQSIHTFANESDEVVKFTVFRLVLDGKDQREMIKNDKRVVEGNL